jgi:hypothetical protein
MTKILGAAAIDLSGVERRSQSRRVLDPSERIAEVLFGLIMVLTFTGSLSIAESGRDDVRAMLIGALGCNIAWGIIDGVLYLMGCLADRGRNLRIYRAVHQAPDAAGAGTALAVALPPIVQSVMERSDLERVSERLRRLPAAPDRPRLRAEDWKGALGVFLIVFLSTFPVAIPFMLMDDAMRALRMSNAIAVAMLFVAGVAYGRAVGWSPWLVGIGMVLLGSALVVMTMALGG